MSFKNFDRRMPAIPINRFAMVPRNDVPRSRIVSPARNKCTFQTGKLIPIFLAESLPGDSWNIALNVFARLQTLINPIMDDVFVETWGFFCPNRLVWDNFVRQMGEQDDPSDSISFLTPTLTSEAAGFPVDSLADYFGLPTVGQVPGQDVTVSALPFRMYNLIWNQWFRDENIQDSVPVSKGNGPDSLVDYNLLYRNKQHDYFTSCLPSPQKGSTAVSLPLNGNAYIRGIGLTGTSGGVTAPPPTITQPPNPGGATLLLTGPVAPAYDDTGNQNNLWIKHDSGTPDVYADLSTATGATINALRLAIATQQFLEKDARGGTRYTELIQSHFGVMNEDYRLQRPEYIGGGKSYISINSVPQTSGLNASDPRPLGTLGATGTFADRHRFTYNCTEHGYIMILAQVSAPKTYYQGIPRHWHRQTRYDYYWSTFAHLGEQAVLRKEIYASGLPATDDIVFGYQERYAEYRYFPSQICSKFKGYVSGNIDEWHLAQQFGSAPTLNDAFLQDNLPFNRVLAAGDSANNQQILWDSMATVSVVRPMPMYSVPGLRSL